MKLIQIIVLITFAVTLCAETEKKEEIKTVIKNAAANLRKEDKIKPLSEIKNEIKSEISKKAAEIKKEEKTKEEKKYIYKLTPADCNPIKNNRSVHVFEITDFEYIFKNSRRFWISGGSLKGIEKGMEITICKNTGSFRFYPIAKAEISEVWDDKAIATLNDAETNVDENLPENPYYLTKGDMILFTETAKLIYDPAWFKKKPKPKPKKTIPPFEYRKEFFPEFREELLKDKVKEDEKKSEKKEAEKENKINENIKKEDKNVI